MRVWNILEVRFKKRKKLRNRGKIAIFTNRNKKNIKQKDMNLTKLLGKSVLVALLGMTGITAAAQKSTISPIPQMIEWGNEKAFDNSVTFKLKGAATADKDAVALLGKYTCDNGKGIKLVIGERGDKAVKKYNALIPQKREGYYLSITPKEVVIAGNDESGTYYGVQTFLQIMQNAEVFPVTISDFPAVATRGMVEGYYGNPYSEADRKDMFEFFGKQKMNTYIYGPKDDIYHRAKWRVEYPADQAAKIKEYAEAAKKNKVDFVWAIHPGNDIKWNMTDSLNMIKKLNAMYELGIRTYAVFFDDIWGEGTDATRQAALLNYITDEFVKKHDDVAPLILCPTQYNKGWTSGNYLDILGEKAYKEIDIMWTGNSVIDMINKEDMNWINIRIKRNAYIWLNYPVNDYCVDHMLMGPTYGNDLDIAPMLAGFTSNPMEYAEASKVSLYSIADYTWNTIQYDADASWQRAMEYLVPQNTDEFRLFCENNIDLGPTGHGLRRKGESPRFNAALEKFNTALATNDTTKAAEILSEHFNKMIVAAETLVNSGETPRLTAEIEPWCKSMKLLAYKGLSTMSMYKALASGNTKEFVDSYLTYLEYDKQQMAIRSRDFPGSIKNPTPVVATTFIVPFIKKSVAELIDAYKKNYTYRLDVFPYRLIENGAYFIKVNGKYLTNAQENVPRTAPQFAADRDMIKPQRQEWQISFDTETERYKIVNIQDNRYLNENGMFSAGNATNPYEAAWHSYIMERNADGKYSIQNAGRAGKGFWMLSNDDTRIVSGSNDSDKFIFEIIPVSSK